jgi:hypothetical protein
MVWKNGLIIFGSTGKLTCSPKYQPTKAVFQEIQYGT